MSMVYRIAKWSEVFENSESRKLKNLNWVPLPTSFSSNGYTSLLDDFGEDAPALYGAWCALVCFASTCAIRGTLSNSKGNPIRVSQISRVTGFPSEVFERLIDWATQESIGWLVPVNDDENHQKHGEKLISGNSPDVPADFPERREGKGREENRREEKRIINHDDDRQTDMDQEITRHRASSFGHSVGQSPVVVVEDVDQRFGRIDQEGLKIKANQLFEHCLGLDRGFVWQVASVAFLIEPAIVDDFIISLKSGTVTSRQRWLRAAIRKACDERGFNWHEVKQKCPPCPPRKEKATT